MARVSPGLLAFNRGEISKIALARVDVAKLQLAAECQLNWLPFVVGPMMLRPGMLYVGEVLGDAAAKLIRFVYSKTDTALLELTANQMRIWIGEVLLARPSVATVILPFVGTNWDLVTNTMPVGVPNGAIASVSGGALTLTCTPVGGLAQAQQAITVAGGDHNKEHGIRIVVTNGPVTFRAGSSAGLSDVIAQTVLDTGTHSLSCVPAGNFTIQIESTDAWNKIVASCAIEAAGTVVLPTPWGASDLANVRYDQSLDVLYIACYGQQQQMIQRRGTRPNARGWSVVTYHSSDGPFNALPTIPNCVLTPSVYYGNGTLASSKPLFQSGHVGGLFRLFCPGQLNNCVLGGQGAFSDPLRISGIGAERKITGAISGTWSGKLTLQRSYTDAVTGFTINTVNISTFTASGTFIYDDVTSLSGTYNNVIVWLRIGFAKPGDYGGGAASVTWSSVGEIIVTGNAGANQGGQYAVVRVTGYNSPISVNIEAVTAPESIALGMVTPIPTLTGTSDWVEGQWSGVAGWPTSVAIHEGRLCWFGGAKAWLSASNNYSNFADINFDGTSPGDGGAINVTLGSGPGDNIPWALSLTRLLIGREQSIASARSSNFDQPLTPIDIVIRDCSDQGAQRLPAIKAGKRGIYVQQSNRRVYELAFSGQELDYDERDLTRLNLDIGLPGFTDIDKLTQPDKMIFLPRGDGQVAALLYDVKDEVEAWWRLQTLGIVENVAVLPSAGTEDAVYFVVRRVINGVTKRFIEKLALRDDCVGGLLNKQFDCATVYGGVPVASVQAPQLANTTVGVWADGAYLGTAAADGSGNVAMPDGQTHSNIVVGLSGQVLQGSTSQSLPNGAAPDQVFASPSATLSVPAALNGYPCEVFADQQPSGRQVHVGALVAAGGVVTLPNGMLASAITACFGYVAPFMSAKLAYGAQLGSPVTQKKKIDHVGLVLYDAHPSGLRFGQRLDALDAMPAIEDSAAVGVGIWSEFDEPMIELPGEYDSDSRLCLLAQAPLPCKVGAAVIGLKTNEK